MTTLRKKITSGRSEKVRDARVAKRFVEELSWLLNSYSHLDFKTLPHLAIDANSRPTNKQSLQSKRLSQYTSKNPNIHFLIGVLPEVFSDEKIFLSNEQLVDFATTALDLRISRWEKRSRYELIGLIVCETAKLDDDRLTLLVRALTKLLINDPNARQLLQRRSNNRMNWNEIIQKLTADDQ